MIVMDASTLVSAAMNVGGVPYLAFRKARATDILAMSQFVFDEIFEVLHRPRLARFIDSDLRDDLLDRLVSSTVWVDPLLAVTDCRDPKDNKYLELALAASAGTIVSSDNDLLVLHPWRGISVLRPSDYLGSA